MEANIGTLEPNETIYFSSGEYEKEFKIFINSTVTSNTFFTISMYVSGNDSVYYSKQLLDVFVNVEVAEASQSIQLTTDVEENVIYSGGFSNFLRLSLPVFTQVDLVVNTSISNNEDNSTEFYLYKSDEMTFKPGEKDLILQIKNLKEYENTTTVSDL